MGKAPKSATALREVQEGITQKGGGGIKGQKCAAEPDGARVTCCSCNTDCRSAQQQHGSRGLQSDGAGAVWLVVAWPLVAQTWRSGGRVHVQSAEERLERVSSPAASTHAHACHCHIPERMLLIPKGSGAHLASQQAAQARAV